MKTRNRILILGVVIIALAGFAWLVLKPHEPVYQGRPLTVWLEAYFNSMSATPDKRDLVQLQNQSAAISRIGTNGIPTLLRLAQAKDSAMKSKLVLLARKQTFIPFHHLHTDIESRSMAFF